MEKGNVFDQAFDFLEAEKFEEAAAAFADCMSEYVLNGSIGYCFSNMRAGNFEKAAAVLEKIKYEDKLKWQKFIHQLLAYCYAALGETEKSREFYKAYTGYVIRYDEIVDEELEEEYGDNSDEEEDEDEYNEKQQDDDPSLSFSEFHSFWKSYLLHFPDAFRNWYHYLKKKEQLPDLGEKGPYYIYLELTEWTEVMLNEHPENLDAEIDYESLSGDYLKLAQEFSPRHMADLLFKKGEQCRKTNWEEAMGYFREAVRHDPKYGPAMRFLIIDACDKKEYDSALELTETYYALHKDSKYGLDSVVKSLCVKTYFECAMYKAETGEYEVAMQLFSKCMDIRGTGLTVTEMEDKWLAMVEYNERFVFTSDQAEERARRSLLLLEITLSDKRTAKGLAMKGLVLCSIDRLEEGFACCAEARQIDPVYFHTPFVEACLLLGMNAPRAEVYKAFNECKRLNADFIYRAQGGFKSLKDDPEYHQVFLTNQIISE